MDQRFPFLRPKEIWPKFLGKKKKAIKQTNKNHQKTITFHHLPQGMPGVVPPFPFPRPIVCVTFWQESSAVCLPIIYSPSESSSAVRPFLTLPTIRQGSPHPGGLGEKGHPRGCCVGDAGMVFLGQSVQECPMPSKDKSKAFLAHLGNSELLQSTPCQLVLRSQEVSLAAGR